MPYYPQWKIYPEYDKEGLLAQKLSMMWKSLGSNNFTPAIQHLKKTSK
jgi:hypothetical protein